MIFQHIKKIIKQLFTETDNQTFCPVRLLAMVGSVQFLGLTLAGYIQHGTFDGKDFAVGLGALLGGVGLALGMKKDTPKE